MSPASSFARGLPAALVFLTRLPVRTPLEPEDFRAASAFFPLVGAFVGLVSGVVFVVARPLGELVAAFLAVGASVLLTGAMHEDGLADTADALFGGTSRERVLAIAKDPRIGTFGVLALLLVVGARVACVAAHPGRAVVGFVLAHVLSRLAATATMVALPYVQDPAVSRSSSVLGAGPEHLRVAGAISAAILLALVLLRALPLVAAAAVVVVAALVAAGLGAWYKARLGGILGDLLGATIQLVDLGIWLTLATELG